MRPTEGLEWISLRQGESETGLGLIRGIHPKCLPGETPYTVDGVQMVLLDVVNSNLPTEFFGLLKIETEDNHQS